MKTIAGPKLGFFTGQQVAKYGDVFREWLESDGQTTERAHRGIASSHPEKRAPGSQAIDRGNAVSRIRRDP